MVPAGLHRTRIGRLSFFVSVFCLKRKPVSSVIIKLSITICFFTIFIGTRRLHIDERTPRYNRPFRPTTEVNRRQSANKTVIKQQR